MTDQLDRLRAVARGDVATVVPVTPISEVGAPTTRSIRRGTARGDPAAVTGFQWWAANVAVVVGNPKPNSRTLRVALAATDALSRPALGSGARSVIDLSQVASELFDPTSKMVNDLIEAVEDSDLVVVASPTYKATYTGLLKSFLDRFSMNALAQTVGVAVMTGASPLHALAPEIHLRPLLVELGACTPSRGLYVTEQQLDDLDAVVENWAESARPLIERALFPL